jgi:hypothetical protein
MASPEGIVATFSVTTPLFLGDVQRQATRLSPQSLKGALRFWWRALAWQRCLDEAGGDRAAALKELHRREARIFGTAGEAGEKELGQARVRLAIAAEALGRPPCTTCARCTGRLSGAGRQAAKQPETRRIGHESPSRAASCRPPPECDPKPIRSTRCATASATPRHRRSRRNHLADMTYSSRLSLPGSLPARAPQPSSDAAVDPAQSQR